MAKTSYKGIIARSKALESKKFSGVRAAVSPRFGDTDASGGTYDPETIPIVGAQNYTRLGTVAVQGVFRFVPGDDPQIDLSFSPNGGVAYALLSVNLARYTTAGAPGNLPIALLEEDHPIALDVLGSGDSNQVTGARGTAGNAAVGFLSRESSLRDPILLAEFSNQDPALVRGRPAGWPDLTVVPDDQVFIVRAACEPISREAYERILALGRAVVVRS